MKKRWRRELSVLLTAVLLLSVPGVLELTAAAVERMGTAIQAADGAVDLSATQAEGDAALHSPILLGTNTTYIPDNGEAWSVTFSPDTGTITGFEPGESFDGTVTLPDEIEATAVTGIGNQVFAGQKGLTEITLPNKLETIGEGAFSQSGLTNIDLKSVKIIGSSAFQGSALGRVTIPSSVTELGDNAFYECNQLEAVVIEGQIASLGDYMFYACGNLSSVRLPDTLEEIGRWAFAHCGQLRSIELPAGTRIGYYAFQASGLTGINLEQVSYVDDYAFSEAALQEVCLPFGSDQWGTGVFAKCEQLTTAEIAEGNTTIVSRTFTGCTGLSSVMLPSTLTSIGDEAFYNTSSLISIDLPNTLSTIGERAFAASGLTHIDLSWVKNIGYCAFQSSGLVSVTIPASATSFEGMAFYNCFKLEEAVIAEGVSVLEYGMFAECSALTSVILPSTLTSIGEGAFSRCYSLSNIDLPEDHLADIGAYAFQETQIATVTIPNSVTSIGDSVFSGCTSLTDIILPDGLLTVGDSAFSGCTNLTSITLPDSLTSIGANAFSRCGLVTLDIPESVLTIGDQAFAWNENLTMVQIPNPGTAIGISAFACSTAANITIRCVPYGYAYEYALEHGHSILFIGIEGTVQASASVCAPDGSPLEEGFIVTWHDKSTGEQVAEGVSVTLADGLKTYECRVSLEEELSLLYETPEPQTVTPEDSGSVVFTLRAYETTLLSGRVTNKDGAPIQGAEVQITQIFGGMSSAIHTLTTDSDGEFLLTVSKVPTTVAIQAEGYYSASRYADATKLFELGQITMTETIGDRIQLILTQVYAAKTGEISQKRTMPDAAGLKFTLTKDGQPVTDFEVQGTDLVFQPDVVQAGDTLLLSAEDTQGNYTAEGIWVTLDANRTGSAQITLTENGRFYLPSVSAAQAVEMMLFDESGALFSAGAVQCPMESLPLPEGRYQLVLLEKTSLLASVPHISRLGELGLTDGTAYVRVPVTIEEGVITQLEPVTVPELDTDILTGAVLEHGSIHVSPGQATINELACLRIDFSLKSGTAESIQLDVKGNMSIVGAAVLGQQVLDTAVNGNTITILMPQNVSEGVVYLACKMSRAESSYISAFLVTGEQIIPMGGTTLTLPAGTISLLGKTGSVTNRITGQTFPHAAVTLYDNGVEIGKAEANAAGRWQGHFDLAGPLYNSSHHYIYAVITADGLDEPAVTASQLVTYDSSASAALESVTMYNISDMGEMKSIFYFDPPDLTAQDTRSYSMWPGNYPDFIFQVKFSGDNSQLDQVYVVTENSDGERTYVETVYDPASGQWVGTHQYYVFEDAPRGVGVIYSFKNSGARYTTFDEEKSMDHILAYVQEDTQALQGLIGTEEEHLPLTIVVEEDQEDYIRVRLDGTADSQARGLLWYELCQEPETRSVQELESAGFYPLDETGTVYSLTTYGESVVTVYAIPEEQIRFTETYRFEADLAAALMKSVVASGDAGVQGISVFSGGDFSSQIGDLFKEPGKLVDGLNEVYDWISVASFIKNVIQLGEQQVIWRTELNGNVDTLTQNAQTLVMAMGALCKDGSPRVPDHVRPAMQAQLEGLIGEIQIYRETGTYRINISFAAQLASIVGGKAVDKVWSGLFENASAMVKRFANTGKAATEQFTEIGMQWMEPELDDIMINGMKDADGNVIPINQMPLALYTAPSIENYINATAADLYSRLEDVRAVFMSYQCDPQDPRWDLPADSLESELKEITPILDPSGYVYEAVPSNRLEGVAATVFYRDTEGREIQWNAADYDQLNPQITAADGTYTWFVPEGQWKICFTKDGYQSADSSGVPAAVGNIEYSGWLPVPPPQFGVNVAMVSKDAPAVENVTVYTDRIEVVFSQYMDIPSVKGAITLSRGETEIAAGVEALNAEFDLEGTTQYATRFAVTPADGKCIGALSISTGAMNYAGTAVKEQYNQILPAPVQRPTAITAGELSLVIHEAATLPIILNNGAAETPLTVESLTPSLLHISTQTVTTGADGTAAVTITGLLPGVGQIRVTEPVSGLSEIFSVRIVMTAADLPDTPKPHPEPEPVTAALSDGTLVTTGMTLENGARIVLSTATQGAAIRYTLNDTCPCTETALTYNSPITITEDTVIRAAAVIDGVYSDTIRLELAVKHPNGGQTGQGSSSGGSAGYANYAVETIGGDHGTITASPTRAGKGDIVTIAVTPDEGYILHILTVMDEEGAEVKIADAGGGKYCFTMPNGRVIVNAVFERSGEAAIAFTDVHSADYFYDAVVWAVNHSVTSGTTDTTFSPNSVCTRAQAVTFLWRAAGSPQPKTSVNPFRDVQERDYYYRAVLWAVENNITVGTGIDAFNPDAACTRSQVVTFLYRYHGSEATVKANFTDVREDAYYYDAVQWAAQNGITSGTGASTFSPYSDCTRAQIVTFLYRDLKK